MPGTPELTPAPRGRATLTTWTTSALRSFSRRRLRFSARRCFFSWNAQGEGLWVWGPRQPRSLRPRRSESWQSPQWGGEGLLARVQVMPGGGCVLEVGMWKARKEQSLCPWDQRPTVVGRL